MLLLLLFNLFVACIFIYTPALTYLRNNKCHLSLDSGFTSNFIDSRQARKHQQQQQKQQQQPHRSENKNKSKRIVEGGLAKKGKNNLNKCKVLSASWTSKMVARNEICGTPHPHPHTPITHITAASHSNRDVATDPGNTISARSVCCLLFTIGFSLHLQTSFGYRSRNYRNFIISNRFSLNGCYKKL